MITSISYRCTIVAFVINFPGALACYLDLSNFLLESGLSYFRVLYGVFQ